MEPRRASFLVELGRLALTVCRTWCQVDVIAEQDSHGQASKGRVVLT